MTGAGDTVGQPSVEYRVIGMIHSPYVERAGMPIQPTGARGVYGTVDILPEFAGGLDDLDGFSHVILLYHLHRAKAPHLTVTPFLDTDPHGVFATRAPCRPNPIGLSIVRLLHIDGASLHIEGVDILDGTPLLDIKPYIPEFDEHPDAKVGWLEKSRGLVRAKRSDDRFS